MSKNKKKIALLISLLIIITATVGTTVAYLTAKTDTITNTFDPSEVLCEVKADRSVANTGDIAAYIRAAVVVNWVDGDNVYGIAPKESDYTIKYDDSWKQGADGYWYYLDRVEKGASTSELFTEFGLNSDVTAPNGYTLTVQIIAEAIQADGVNTSGTPAVVDAWSTGVSGIDSSDQLIVIKGGN